MVNRSIMSKFCLVLCIAFMSILLFSSAGICKDTNHTSKSKSNKLFEVVVEEGQQYIGSFDLKLNEDNSFPGQTLKIVAYNPSNNPPTIVIECTSDSNNRKRRLVLPLNFHNYSQQTCGDAVLSFIGIR